MFGHHPSWRPASGEEYARDLTLMFKDGTVKVRDVLLALVVIDTGPQLDGDGRGLSGNLLTCLDPLGAVSLLEQAAAQLIDGMSEAERAQYFENREHEWDIRELGETP